MTNDKLFNILSDVSTARIAALQAQQARIDRMWAEWEVASRMSNYCQDLSNRAKYVRRAADLAEMLSACA